VWYEDFLAHCAKGLCDENLLFLEAVDKYTGKPDGSYDFKYIYDLFIHSRGGKEVNIIKDQRISLDVIYNNIKDTDFDDAYDYVKVNLKDPFMCYKGSLPKNIGFS
jgi:hypothetical protein